MLCRTTLLALGCIAALSARAWADPGMTWSQERAWLASNTHVFFETINRAYDKDLGVTVGTANVKGGPRNWILHAVLTKSDVVSEETYTFSKGGSVMSLEQGNRASQALIRRMYVGSPVLDEYLNASLVTTVPIYGEQGKEEFFAVKDGKFGFMLDPYEVTIFRNSELQERIKQAQYCANHKGCA